MTFFRFIQSKSVKRAYRRDIYYLLATGIHIIPLYALMRRNVESGNNRGEHSEEDDGVEDGEHHEVRQGDKRDKRC